MRFASSTGPARRPGCPRSPSYRSSARSASTSGRACSPARCTPRSAARLTRASEITSRDHSASSSTTSSGTGAAGGGHPGATADGSSGAQAVPRTERLRGHARPRSQPPEPRRLPLPRHPRPPRAPRRRRSPVPRRGPWPAQAEWSWSASRAATRPPLSRGRRAPAPAPIEQPLSAAAPPHDLRRPRGQGRRSADPGGTDAARAARYARRLPRSEWHATQPAATSGSPARRALLRALRARPERRLNGGAVTLGSELATFDVAGEVLCMIADRACE